MKKGSKFQVILLIGFGAFCVAGVLIFAFAVGGGNANTTGPVVIWGTLPQAAFTTVIRAGAENNAQLNQVLYEEKDPTTFEAELTEALASGRGPDLFILRQDYAMKNAGKVVPIPYDSLSQSQFETTFVAASEPFLSQGGVLAVPLAIDPLVLYWNKDLLGAAGYAGPPAYWDELIPMATYVTGANDQVNLHAVTRRDASNSIKKSAIALGEYRNITNAKDLLAMLILQAGGTITTRDATSHILPAIAPKTGGTGAGSASDSALRFYTEFADPSKNHYSWNRSLSESRAAFAAGDLGIYIGYASEEALIRRMNPNLNFAPGAMPQIRPLPGASASDRTLTFARVYGFAISRASRNQNGAVTVAYLLASGPYSESLSSALGIPSARTDLLLPLLAKKGGEQTLGLRESHEQIVGRAAIISRSWIDPDPDKTGEIFRSMIENTVSGAVRSTEAVQRADQELGHLLGL